MRKEDYIGLAMCYALKTAEKALQLILDEKLKMDHVSSQKILSGVTWKISKLHGKMCNHIYSTEVGIMLRNAYFRQSQNIKITRCKI